MMGLLAALFVIALAGSPSASVYLFATVSADSRSLTITTEAGPLSAPRTQESQAGFSDPRVSADGRLVGWLVLTPNCCTSYPLPTVLVVFRDGEVVRHFDEAPPIWAWAFEADGSEVAYRQEYPHGAPASFFKLRRIADGALLAEFHCGPFTSGSGVNAMASGEPAEVPSWAAPIADDRCRPRTDARPPDTPRPLQPPATPSPR